MEVNQINLEVWQVGFYHIIEYFHTHNKPRMIFIINCGIPFLLTSPQI